MAKIQIVIDSTAYIPKEEVQRMGIKVVPLFVTFKGKTEEEGYPGSFKPFFERLKNSREFPTTSQPSIGAFAAVYEEALDAGFEVLTLVFSSKLSGTYNSAVSAAAMVDPKRITVVDTQAAVCTYRFLIERAFKLAEAGRSREEIAKVILEEKDRMGIRLTVETLEYLKRGGRLTGAQALLGSMLNIKPIISLTEGKLIPVGKARGKAKAIEMMIEDIPENVKRIAIAHILDLDEVLEIKGILEEKYRGITVEIDEIGPVIGAHLGPKAIGICYHW
mgnify:CR=1 FL=1